MEKLICENKEYEYFDYPLEEKFEKKVVEFSEKIFGGNQSI